MDAPWELDGTPLHRLHTLHREAMAAFSLEARQESLFGGQSPREVVLSGRYVSLDVGGGESCGREQAGESEHLQDALTAITAALSQSQPRAGPLEVVGPAGVGKSTLLQRLLGDWASATRLTQFAFVFPLALAELGFGTGERSLADLLSQQHPHIPAASLESVLQNPQALLFLLDGLDENLLGAAPPCSDPNQPAPLSGLVSGLVRRTLVPGAAVLVTSRPRALPLKPASNSEGERVEVRGLSPEGRRVYVRQFFTDPQEATEVLEHMERTVGSCDLAHLPRFCWTVCSVYREALAAGRGLPQTLTHVYTDATASLIQRHAVGEEPAGALLTGLGKMADRAVLKGAESCSQEEMAAFGLPPVLSSALLREFLRPDGPPEMEPCSFSFPLPALAQFLLAVAYHRGCWDGGSLADLLKQAAGKADLLELFLAGLCDPSQSAPLEGAVGKFNSDRSLEFTAWLKDTTQQAMESHFHPPERPLWCFRLLHQRQDPALVVATIGSGSHLGRCYEGLSAQDSLALSYVATCLGEMELLNLYRSKGLSEEVLHHLLPAMGLAKKILLASCSFHTGAYAALTAGLQRGSVCELDLSHSSIGDSEAQSLCAGLAGSSLQILRVTNCGLTEVGCSYLAGALCSSPLRLLDLHGNDIMDAGLVKLSLSLRSPQCQLQELRLSMCEVTGASMEALSSALCGGSSVLTSLNLDGNKLGDIGMNHISSALRDPHCRLQSLIVSDCCLTEACCAGLSIALQEAGRAMTHLDLSVNELGDAGVQLLIRAFKTSDCVPRSLRLAACELGEQTFRELADVVRMEGSRLRELDVGVQQVGDAGAKHLWEALQDPVCALEHLDVDMVGLTDACVAELCAAVLASRSLKGLVLKNNELTDDAVPALVAMAKESRTLQELNLQYNEFSEEVFELMDTCEKIRY